MTETEQLAEVIVEGINAGIIPMLERIAALESRLEALETRLAAIEAAK